MSRDAAHRPTAAAAQAEPSAVSPLLVVRPDARTGTLRVRGHLDRLGAELIAASAEALCRQGHRHLHLRLEAPTADPEVLALLTGLVERFAADGVRLVVD